METAKLFRLSWIILFTLFVIWGVTTNDFGVSPFESTVREYARVHTETEFQIIAKFIVPLFCFGFGWFSRQIFSDFMGKYFKKN